MLCNEIGMPLFFTLTAGQESDYSQAKTLIDYHPSTHIIADRGYDSDEIVSYIESRGVKAIIPPRSNRKVRRSFDRIAYKLRNRIERLFGKIKQHRRLATRFEKSVVNYASMVYIACSLIWLNQM